MKEVDLGITKTIEFYDYVIIGFDKKFLKLTEGEQLEFQAKIDEGGKLVLLGPQLIRPSKTRVDNNVM